MQLFRNIHNINKYKTNKIKFKIKIYSQNDKITQIHQKKKYKTKIKHRKNTTPKIKNKNEKERNNLSAK